MNHCNYNRDGSKEIVLDFRIFFHLNDCIRLAKINAWISIKIQKIHVCSIVLLTYRLAKASLMTFIEAEWWQNEMIIIENVLDWTNDEVLVKSWKRQIPIALLSRNYVVTMRKENFKKEKKLTRNLTQSITLTTSTWRVESLCIHNSVQISIQSRTERISHNSQFESGSGWKSVC